MKRAFALGAGVVLAAVLAGCASTSTAEPALPDAIALDAQPLPLSSQDTREDNVGRLRYRGGLVITSPDKRFGGWSGLRVSSDGRHMLSQSDEAHFLKAALLYNAKGDLAGIASGQIADMRDLEGRTMTGKEGDAEGLALLTPNINGPVAVSFERNHRIWQYDLSRGLDVKPVAIAAPDEIGELGFNVGLESLVQLRPDTLLAIGETPQLGPDGDHPAWLIPAPGAQDHAFARLSVEHHAPYEISDAALSPDGKHLYLLERHFYDLVRGLVIAVREIDAASIKPGARLEGDEIASFTMRQNIDNMEGMALRTGAHGETLLYIISDDNYNPVERTLLLMFEIQ
jgi:hypothetical protein